MTDVNGASPALRVRIVGLGAIGSRVALSMLRSGAEVVGVDIDARRVEAIRRGDGDDVVTALASYVGTSLHVRTELASCPFDATVICVATWHETAGLDATSVLGVVRELVPLLSPGELVTIESSVPPGTTENAVRPLVEASSDLVVGSDVFLAFSPERLDIAVDLTLTEIPKVVGGATDACAEHAMRFYRQLGVPVIRAQSATAAEATKLFENAYRLVNIEFANEMSLLFRTLGLDPKEVVRAAATKPFGFQPFWPSAGAGGHCIPAAGRAVRALASGSAVATPILSAAVEQNRAAPERVVALLCEDDVAAPARILVLGAGYKAGSTETSESPGLRLARSLGDLGYRVVLADDLVTGPFGSTTIDRPAALAGRTFDATIVVAWQDAFRDLQHRGTTLGQVLDLSGERHSRAAEL